MSGFWSFLRAKCQALLQDSICNYCQYPIPSGIADCLTHFCEPCLEQLNLREAFPLTRTAQTSTYAATLFNAQNRRLIYRYKFYGRERNAETLSRLLVTYWQRVLEAAPADLAQDMKMVQGGNAHAVVVVPIPAHEGKDSHLHKIAESFAQQFGYAYEPELLTWSRAVQPQHSLTGKKRRFSNVQGNMSVLYQHNPKALLSTRRVLLLDDIHTTGATLHEAAQAFLRCPAYDGAVTSLALSYLPLAFQKNRPETHYPAVNTSDTDADLALH